MPSGAPSPNSHAERGTFYWRPLGVVPATGQQAYTRAFALLNASDAECPEWIVEVWGTHGTAGLVAPPPRAVPAEGTDMQRPTFPGQARIGYTTGAVRRELILDLTGDIRINVPPAAQVDVAVMLPTQSARVSYLSNPPTFQESQLVNDTAVYLIGSVSAAAHALGGRRRTADSDCEDGPEPHRIILPQVERSRLRATVVWNIDAAASTVINIPAGAQRLTAYLGPQAAAGVVPSASLRWVATDDTGAAPTPLGEFSPNVPSVVPGMAVGVLVQNGAFPLRLTAVYEVE